MDFRFSSKRDLYYEKAMKLDFQEGMRVTQISRAIPLSRAILYQWITIFAEQNPQMASMKGVKKVKKASGPSQETQTEELPKTVLGLQAELKRLRAQLKKAEIKKNTQSTMRRRTISLLKLRIYVLIHLITSSLDSRGNFQLINLVFFLPGHELKTLIVLQNNIS